MLSSYCFQSLMLGFVESSYVWSSWWLDPTRMIWRGFQWEIFWGLVHRAEAWACAQDLENVFWWLGFCCCSFWEKKKKKKKLYCCTLYFSLIIVKSLQLYECKQIAELCKYCLVRVIVFLWCVFSLFLFFTGLEILW